MKKLLSLLSCLGLVLAVGILCALAQPLPASPGLLLEHPALPMLGMAGMIINQGNLQVLFTGFKAAFNTGFRDVKPKWDRLATLVPSSTAQETYAWLGQYPRLREWLGDRQVKGMAAHSYTVVNKTFESTISIPRENIEDDTYGVFTPLFQEMAFAAAIHPDELVFALLQAGFASKCYDGQNFFDANHPVGAGVVSNNGGGAGTQWYLLDVSRPLKPLLFQKRREYALQAMIQLEDERVFMSKEFRYGIDARCNVGLGFWQMAYGSKQVLDANAATGYPAARAAMQGFTSDEGRPLGIMPNLLVVPPSLEGAARALVGAQYNAAGASNPWYNTADLLVVPWLT